MALRSLYLASWERGAGPAWVARHGLSSAQYQKAFDDFVKQGFRLRCVSGHEAAGKSVYAAIWDKSGGGAWAARHGLTAAQYQKTFDDLVKTGHRLRVVNAHAVGGKARFAAIWEKAAGPDWSARHGLDGAGYQKAFDDHVKQGFRLRWVTTYAESGGARYAALWEKSAGPAWVARHGMEEAAYRKAAAGFAAEGYDLVCGNAVTLGGKDFYAALWEKTPVSSVTHHGMTAATYQLKFDQLVADGLRPRFVAGYCGADPVDVVLRFTMQQQTQGNWCWAANAVSVSRYYVPTSSWTQCQVANAQTGFSNCCGSGASGQCNIYGFLGAALTTVGHFNRQTSTITSFADVEAEMLAGRPLGTRTAWSGGGAHFVHITGTEDDDCVWVADSGDGMTTLVTYDKFKTSYRDSGSWTHSYFTEA